MSSALWPDYMKPYEKFIVEFTKRLLVVHVLVSWMTIIRLNDLVINGWVLIIYMMPLLESSPLKVLWRCFGFSR